VITFNPAIFCEYVHLACACDFSDEFCGVEVLEFTFVLEQLVKINESNDRDAKKTSL
jgi:hypothetical protein